MKTTSTLLTLALMFLLNNRAHSQDLTPINVGATLPDYTFNSSSNIITLQMSIRNIGYFNSTQFDVSIFVKDVNTGTEYEIDRANQSGLSYSQLNNGNTLQIQNWNIDLDNNPQVPGGTFRLEARINDDNAASETNYSNNSENFSNSTFVYSKTSVGISSTNKDHLISTYPNPVQNQMFFIQKVEKETSIEIFDLLGNKVKAFEINQKLSEVDVSDLQNGIYVYRITSNSADLFESGKFTKI